jgi:hypothetical protein
MALQKLIFRRNAYCVDLDIFRASYRISVKATTELVSCNWWVLPAHLVLLWVNQKPFPEYRAVFEFHIGATKPPISTVRLNVNSRISRSFQLSQYQNRVDFFDSGLKTFKVKSSSRQMFVIPRITYDTISTTTSSNMHESHTVAIYE